jgi:putative tricarboxylic transport membrane protein
VEDGKRSGIDRAAELVLAIGVVALGGLVLWKTGEIRITPMNARIGPRVIPYVVGSGLVVAGVWYVIELLLGRGSSPSRGEEGEDVDLSEPTDWRTIGFIAAALLAYLLLIERAGFIVASSVLFFVAAFGMGSRRLARDAVIAVALSVAVFLIFTRGLSLRLPEGIVPLELVRGPW